MTLQLAHDDPRPTCTRCPRRLGKAEAEVGMCKFCQRVRARNEQLRPRKDP